MKSVRPLHVMGALGASPLMTNGATALPAAFVGAGDTASSATKMEPPVKATAPASSSCVP